MKKKIATRISSLLVLLAMVVLMVVSFVTPAIGETIDSAEGKFTKLENVETNWQQYLDGSVVTKLPETVKPTDEISVIIKLDNPSILDVYQGTDKTMSISEFSLTSDAAEIRKEILEERSTYLTKLANAGVRYSVGVTYDTVMSGFEIVLKASSFEAACAQLDAGSTAIVGEVYNVAETKLVNNKVDFYEGTGIFDSSDFGISSTGSVFDGSGMVVAVLDTGLDYTHSAFDPARFTSNKLGLTKDQVAALLTDTEASSRYDGLSADDVYLNDKVPFSFDYADNDPDVYSMHNNHGTHVSGVIVGKDDVITGVAPNAQLVSMKIFSDTVDTARTSWILAALEDCVILGVDVINMSLGTACGFSREMDKEAVTGVYDKIRAAGISLVVAASNSYNSAYNSDKNGNLPLTSNPDAGTVGSPSTYDGALSVASIAGEKTPYMLYGSTIMYFIEATNAAQKEKDFFDEILPSDKDSIDIEYILIPGAGRPADYTGMDMAGKIALVRRGSNTFEEKANAAQNAGAAGIIIFNNVAGDIKMNAGTTTIPICSIGQDDGEMLAAAGKGTLRISRSQTSGPFISDFSSWGPTPDLGIKPEITAHGGNILSAVTANTGESGYDRLSGTSMACPNMAGAIALMRQYVMYRFPEIANDPVEVTALVNRLLMSTADIMLNKNGLPYAVRKQGAGLANLESASNTWAYIETYDREDGSVMDKSKLELGDDPAKTGEYTMTFSIVNFGYYDLTYNLSAYVMTEGVSETKTHAGETTVTEQGYLLDGAKIEIVSVKGGAADGMKVVAYAGESCELTVKVTLSDADKAYLDESFENGMYVEGFVVLDAVSGTDVGLSVPYLAFYGDWTKAPLFDLDYYETNKDELDDSIELLDKTLPDAYATRPVGGLYLDYISYLGAYYFIQDPGNEIIAADRDKISLTNTDEAMHSLVSVYAGLLRNADKIVVTITDDATGEVIFEKVANDIRKSYGDGGPIYPANVEIDFDVLDYNLMNNSTYTVKLQGYLDYGNGGLETNEKNTFEFPLTIDFQAPSITDVEFYTEYDRDLEKMRLYAKVAVYDNHYAMAMQVGYISDNPDYDPKDPEDSAYILNPFNSYLTPVYSERNSTSYVTYELTDYIYEIKEKATDGLLDGYDFKNTIAISCYDYALNESTYQIPLPDDITEFYFSETDITLSVNEVFTLEPKSYPGTEWPEFLAYTVFEDGVVNVVGNKIVAVGKGETTVAVQNPTTGDYVYLDVRVIGEGDPGYQYYDKPVAEEFELIGYETLKAYYNVSTDERDIGTTGSITTFNGRQSLKMYPSEMVSINYRLMAYFPEDTEIRVESSNTDIVEIYLDGEDVIVRARAEGYGSVTIGVYLDGQMTYFSETIDIEVKDPYITSGPSLTHYFGLGGVVEFPARLELTDIGAYAFSNYDWVAKGENDEISEEEPTQTKQWFLGEDTITKIILPEGIKTIGAYAFANLTALEEIVLPSTIQSIEYGAFYNCVSLKKVTGIENVQIINKNAFYNCPIEGTLDLSGAYAVSDYAFAINMNDPDLNSTIGAMFVDENGKSTHPNMSVFKGEDEKPVYIWNLAKITDINTSATLQSIGAYTFANQTKLKNVNVAADSVKLGSYVFSGCWSLENIKINSPVIPRGAFFGCHKLENFEIGESVAVIGEYAFYETSVSNFKVAEGNATYAAQNNGAYLISRDGTTLLMVAPKIGSEFRLEGSTVCKIAPAAFSGNTDLRRVIISTVTEVGEYAFADCEGLSEISLGTLSVIGGWAFANTAISTLPVFAPDLQSIGEYAFAYSAIESVYIPDGMVIGEGAFAECVKLASITIGNDVVIGESAFMLDPYCQVHKHLDTEYNVNDYSYLDKETGMRVYYFNFKSALTSLTIGNNVIIGDAAFYYAADLEEATLGEGAVIGDRAFYNAQSLKNVIGLSGATYIGDFAFSGDSFFVYIDPSLSKDTEYIKNNNYILKYFAAPLTSVDISSAEYVGERAFHYCDSLTSVTLNPELESIGAYAFANCEKLTDINLYNVKYIGDCAFAESGLVSVDITGAKTVGEFAFAYCPALTTVTFGVGCETVKEGAFASSKKLSNVQNLRYVSNIESHAFAYTAITDIDLTMAVSLGDQVFIKENFTNIDLTLGKLLNSIGDNPFAMCIIDREDMKREQITDSFNGRPIYSDVYDYEISENVVVINGSIYARVPTGLELIVYIGNDARVAVADNTARISSYAFAGSPVEDVTLPYTLASIGHKAFYGCTRLESVTFTSYRAPILEEEFDQEYFESYENIPTVGTFKYSYIIHNGVDPAIRTIEGLGFIPYYAWGAAARPSNVFYGANFKDYIGHTDGNVVMIRPVNGEDYETFIYGMYFDYVKDGAQAADEVTLAAVEAIQKLAAIGRINLTHEELVIAAREAYDKIATAEQRALISTWLTDDESQSLEAVLTSAERRIEALKSADNNVVEEEDTEESEEEPNYTAVWVIVTVMLVGGVLAVVVIHHRDKKKNKEEKDDEEEEE